MRPSSAWVANGDRCGMSKRSTSPCVGVCAHLGPKGWCVACGMTRDESRNWRALRPFDRKNVVKQLQRRRNRMKAMDHREGQND